MKEKGKVVAVDGKFATVEITRSSACDGCHKQSHQGGCSACSLLGANSKMRSAAYNDAHAHIGDMVEVSSSSLRMVWYSFVLFVAPIILGLIGYFAASLITEDDTTRTWIAIAFFFVAIVCAAIYSYTVSKKRCDLTITKILNEEK